MEGLYVHIPFCHSKCAYCDFYSTPKTGKVDEVIDALIREWELRKDELTGLPDTLYIGGGTPSFLSEDQFTRLVRGLPFTPATVEFTIEVNPEDVTADKVRLWKDNGVNRVSMGVQSFINSELRNVGRRHDSATALRAYGMLRDNGIENISLDLIYGLPGQTLQTWKKSLDTLLDLHPEHFSAYLLSYEKGTLLNARLISGKLTETDEDTIDSMYGYLCRSALKAGYEHYEISNFAVDKRRSVHNSNYWNFSPYLGLGPSAHSYTKGIRRINPADISGYCSKIRDGEVACEVEEETELDLLNDRIMVALRTSDGIELSQLEEHQRKDLLERTKTLPPGHVIVNEERIFIPESKFLVSDAIIRALMAE